MLYGLKEAVAVLLMPLPVVLVLGVLGAILRLWGARRSGTGVLAAAGLFLFLAAWQPCADLLLQPLETAYAPLDTDAVHQPVEAVVVLGAGWAPDAPWPPGTRLNEASLQRLMEGLRLLQVFPEAKLVVSGGSRRPHQAPVAQGYAATAQALGIPAERILLLDSPRDTAQEAYAVRDLLGTESRFILVTSASHMRRAQQHFVRVGLQPLPSPTHFLTGRGERERWSYWIPAAGELRKTERAVYEYLGGWALEWDHRASPDSKDSSKLREH